MTEKIQLASKIMADLDDFSVYMRCQPTRGPQRNQELSREQLIAAYARAHTLLELQNEYQFMLNQAAAQLTGEQIRQMWADNPAQF